MKPKGTTIGNPRSFENGDFNFKEYNVTAGPNNSGKTNPLRILRMPASSEFLNLSITPEIKFDQGKKPPVKLTVETTDLETKMILQALMYRHVEPAYRHIGMAGFGRWLGSRQRDFLFSKRGGGNFSFCQAHHMLLPLI